MRDHDYVPENPGYPRRQCSNGWPEPRAHYAHAWHPTRDTHYWCPGLSPDDAKKARS